MISMKMIFEIIWKKEKALNKLFMKRNFNDALESSENDEEINKEEDNENEENKITSDINVNESDISLANFDGDVLESDNISGEEISIHQLLI